MPPVGEGNGYIKVTSSRTLSKNEWLGEMGFRLSLFASGKDISLETRKRGFYASEPYIKISSRYNMTQSEYENTLIHEMCHVADYIWHDFEEPKRSHGKGFKEMCKYVKEKTNGKYIITATADQYQGSDSKPTFVYQDDEDLVKKVKRLSKELAIVYLRPSSKCTYKEFDYDKGPIYFILDATHEENKKIAQYSVCKSFCSEFVKKYPDMKLRKGLISGIAYTDAKDIKRFLDDNGCEWECYNNTGKYYHKEDFKVIPIEGAKSRISVSNLCQEMKP